MNENQLGTNGETFSKVMRPNWDIFQSYETKIVTKKVMGLNWDLFQSYETKIATKKVMGPIETFAKVMGPKVHLSLKENYPLIVKVLLPINFLNNFFLANPVTWY